MSLAISKQGGSVLWVFGISVFELVGLYYLLCQANSTYLCMYWIAVNLGRYYGIDTMIMTVCLEWGEAVRHR